MKTVSAPNINYAWAEIVIRELGRLGVDRFYVAPGSRSSPLALAAAAYGKNVTVHFDERGLGFTALGYGRAVGRPAVVITTSGTAVANLMPAVCEASQDNVPLMLISADRPPELRDTSANQTMDQVKLFGGFTRWFVDLPCPDSGMPASSLLSTIDQAYHACVSGRPGPVHLNQMFREPLAPIIKNDGSASWLKEVDAWFRGSKPFSHQAVVRTVARHEDVLSAAGYLEAARRGVVVVGSLPDQPSVDAAKRIIRQLRWPVIADIRSGMRIGKAPSNVIQFADQILLSKKFAAANRADIVLHLGERVTSKRVQQYIGACAPRLIMVNDADQRMEQGAPPVLRLKASLDGFADALPTLRTGVAKSWKEKWQKADAVVREEWAALVRHDDRVTEPGTAARVAALTPDDHALFLASSMPIRDMEMYGLRSRNPIPVTASRGVSGIDGTLAAAVGYAQGAKRPVVLVMGDLAMLHDLNSLSLLRDAEYPVRIVVINNDGGGIFSLLPIASVPAHYETCFGTPHGLAFEHAASMFHVGYEKICGAAEFEAAFKKAVSSTCSGIIEVCTNRYENAAEHRRIQLKLKKAADQHA